MTNAPNPEQKSEGRGWSIYDGTYNPQTNPVDPRVIQFIEGVDREPHLVAIESARKRLIAVDTAMYVLWLCNPQLGEDYGQWVSTQRKVANGIMQFSLHDFSQLGSKIRAEAGNLDLSNPPAFSALADMEARKLINSYDQRLFEDAFIAMAIDEKKSYDMRVIGNAFGVILSARENEAEPEDNV